MGDGWKQWTRERLTSAELQGYLMDQSVMAFASAAARDAELLDTAPGMVVYLEDVDRHYRRNAADNAWQVLGVRHHGARTSFPTTAVDGLVVGDTVERTDYRCLWIFTNGTGDASKLWRQLTTALVDDRAGRLALPTTSLHDGFLVHELAGNRRYSWDGTATWIMEGSPHQAPETSIAAGVWTGGANWTLNSATLQEIGQGLAQLTIQVTRNTSTVGVSAIGDVGNTTLATLAAGAAKWQPVAFSGLVSYDGARNAHGYLHTDGRVILTTVAPGAATIAVGEVIQLSGIYRLADPALHS